MDRMAVVFSRMSSIIAQSAFIGTAWLSGAGLLPGAFMSSPLWGPVFFIMPISIVAAMVQQQIWSGRRQPGEHQRAILFGAMNEEELKQALQNMGTLPEWIHFPDVERAEWLNRMLKRLWPHIAKMSEDTIRSCEPMINQYMPSLFKITFELVDMGDKPPRVGGVKVFDEFVSRGEIIMDVELFYAGNNLIKMRAGPVKAGVCNIQVHGKLRLIMKPLISEAPIIAGITYFFLSTPDVDFDLTDVLGPLDSPGIASMIRRAVVEQLNALMVLPHKIFYPMTYNIDATKLVFVPPDGFIRCTVVEAKKLVAADVGLFNRTSDPYTVIKCGAQTFQTQTISSNLNPRWNEVFEFEVDQVTGQEIFVEVFDQDTGPKSKHDFIGRLSIETESVARHGVIDRWYHLEDVERGRIHLKLEWLSINRNPSFFADQKIRIDQIRNENHIPLSVGIVMIYIDSARNLPMPRHILEEPDPYVQLELGLQKYKTRFKLKTLNPVFEEQFILLIHEPQHQQLRIAVMNNATTQMLARTHIKVEDLLTASNMEMSGHFALRGQQSSTNAVLKLHIKLRSFRSTSILESDSKDTLKEGMKERLQDLPPDDAEKELDETPSLAGADKNIDTQSNAGENDLKHVGSRPTALKSKSGASRAKSQSNILHPVPTSTSVAGGGASVLDLGAESGLIRLGFQFFEKTRILEVEVFEVHHIDRLFADIPRLPEKPRVYCKVTLMPLKLIKRTTHELVVDNVAHYDEMMRFKLPGPTKNSSTGVEPSQTSLIIELKVHNKRLPPIIGKPIAVGALKADLDIMTNANRFYDTWYRMMPIDGVNLAKLIAEATVRKQQLSIISMKDLEAARKRRSGSMASEIASLEESVTGALTNRNSMNKSGPRNTTENARSSAESRRNSKLAQQQETTKNKPNAEVEEVNNRRNSKTANASNKQTAVDTSSAESSMKNKAGNKAAQNVANNKPKTREPSAIAEIADEAASLNSTSSSRTMTHAVPASEPNFASTMNVTRKPSISISKYAKP